MQPAQDTGTTYNKTQTNTRTIGSIDSTVDQSCDITRELVNGVTQRRTQSCNEEQNSRPGGENMGVARINRGVARINMGVARIKWRESERNIFSLLKKHVACMHV